MAATAKQPDQQPELLTPLTPGILAIPLPVKGDLTFGRDHDANAVKTGIVNIQVSRLQAKLKYLKPVLGQRGHVELTNQGIGLLRVLRSTERPENATLMRPNEKKKILSGDIVQILQLIRTCQCPLKRPCTCSGGEAISDKLDVVAEWRVDY